MDGRRVHDLLGPVAQAALTAAFLIGRPVPRRRLAHDDGGLLGARLRVAGDVTKERYHRPGAEDPTVVLLPAVRGLVRDGLLLP